MESALITTPSRRRATSSASADLPDAVGPAMRRALTAVTPLLNARGSHAMTHVATLIAGSAIRLDGALVDRALSVLPGGQARTLSDGVAVDIAFAPGALEDPNIAPLGEAVL